MGEEVFQVIKQGALTTVQDLGRYGHQMHGVVVSGAIDPYALRIANLLVGNEENCACLEVTLVGPTLKILTDCTVAITGADLSPTVEGVPVPMWATLSIKGGSTLSFGKLKSGCRAYIAVNGGIDVPSVLGSRSTYVKGAFGGFKGRPLKRGDVLKRGTPPIQIERKTRLVPTLIPNYKKEINLRVIPGPQWNEFSEQSKEIFLSQSYKMTTESDRMGSRLKGKPLALKRDYEHITDPVPLGAIQVPPDGNPIILLADRQTTGGYPKIANVITVDIPKIAQGKPGDTVRFQQVDLSTSHHLLKKEEKMLQLLKLQLREGLRSKSLI